MGKGFGQFLLGFNDGEEKGCHLLFNAQQLYINTVFVAQFAAISFEKHICIHLLLKTISTPISLPLRDRNYNHYSMTSIQWGELIIKNA